MDHHPVDRQWQLASLVHQRAEHSAMQEGLYRVAGRAILDAVLERLADYTENREELRSRTLGALLYPVMLFVVCVAIVFFLLVSVVPKVVMVTNEAVRTSRLSGSSR